MNAVVRHRGGAPVGYLAELGSVEAAAVLLLRRWFEGPEARASVWNEFASAMGPEHGRAAMQSFEGLCDLFIRHGRRPLMRRHTNCTCLGGDEACFANFVGFASEGQHEDALMMAMMLVRPDFAPIAAGLAQDVGLALRSARSRTSSRRERQTKTVH